MYGRKYIELLHISITQSIIFRQFFSCTKVTCQLQYSPLVHTLKVLQEYIYQVVNILLMLHILL